MFTYRQNKCFLPFIHFIYLLQTVFCGKLWFPNLLLDIVDVCITFASVVNVVCVVVLYVSESRTKFQCEHTTFKTQKIPLSPEPHILKQASFIILSQLLFFTTQPLALFCSTHTTVETDVLSASGTTFKLTTFP